MPLKPGHIATENTREKCPEASGRVEGERDHCEIQQSTVLLTRPVLREKELARASLVLPEPNGPGVGWGEMSNSSPLYHPVSPGVGARDKLRITVKFTVQRHKLTERLRSNHRTVEHFPHLTSPSHYKSHLQ